jgi:AAA15 family ATPase/GTPase
MIEVLLNADNDKVFVIDEINRRFHPLLTYKFVEKYLELADERNIQLIVSTHESKLMDFKLLRKDEISFVSKNDLGETEFYSLERFGERFDKKIVASYLQGEYGAIPIFQDYQELKNEG